MNSIQGLAGLSSSTAAYGLSPNKAGDMAHTLLSGAAMGKGSYDAGKIANSLEKIAKSDPALSNALETQVMKQLSVVEQGQLLAAVAKATPTTKPGKNVVMPGDKEAAPVRATGKPIPISETRPHKIQRGDSLDSIMKQHGLTQADLNNLILANPGKILYSKEKGFHIDMKPGEVLNIPKVRAKPLPPLPTK
jgi:LysM repeat protein